jgi:hypothetical protein
MNSAHKPGSNSGIDRGIVTIFLLWIVITVALLILGAVRALGEVGCASFVRASNTRILQHDVNLAVRRRRQECQLRLCG